MDLFHPIFMFIPVFYLLGSLRLVCSSDNDTSSVDALYNSTYFYKSHVIKKIVHGEYYASDSLYQQLLQSGGSSTIEPQICHNTRDSPSELQTAKFPNGSLRYPNRIHLGHYACPLQGKLRAQYCCGDSEQQTCCEPHSNYSWRHIVTTTVYVFIVMGIIAVLVSSGLYVYVEWNRCASRKRQLTPGAAVALYRLANGDAAVSCELNSTVEEPPVYGDIFHPDGTETSLAKDLLIEVSPPTYVEAVQMCDNCDVNAVRTDTREDLVLETATSPQLHSSHPLLHTSSV